MGRRGAAARRLWASALTDLLDLTARSPKVPKVRDKTCPPDPHRLPPTALPEHQTQSKRLQYIALASSGSGHAQLSNSPKLKTDRVIVSIRLIPQVNHLTDPLQEVHSTIQQIAASPNYLCCTRRRQDIVSR